MAGGWSGVREAAISEEAEGDSFMGASVRRTVRQEWRCGGRFEVRDVGDSSSLMKKRTALFGVLLASCILSPLALRAQPPAYAHEETELEGKMDALNGAFRKLRRQIQDATKNAESLKLVEEIRRAADEGAKLIPAKAAELAEAERAKFIADYQGKMKAFGAKVTELEAALKADKNEEAAKILAALSAMQKEGHKEFRKPERR